MRVMLNWLNDWSVAMLFVLLAGINFRKVLIAGSNENKHDGQVLNHRSFMPIENNADDHCEYLPGCDHERHDMLLELLDHPVDEHLPYRRQEGKQNEIESNLRVLTSEI